MPKAANLPSLLLVVAVAVLAVIYKPNLSSSDGFASTTTEIDGLASDPYRWWDEEKMEREGMIFMKFRRVDTSTVANPSPYLRRCMRSGSLLSGKQSKRYRGNTEKAK